MWCTGYMAHGAKNILVNLKRNVYGHSARNDVSSGASVSFTFKSAVPGGEISISYTYKFTNTRNTVYALTTSCAMCACGHMSNPLIHFTYPILPKRWHASLGGSVPPLIPAPFDGSSFRSCSLFRLTGADSAVFALIYALISAMWSLVIHMARIPWCRHSSLPRLTGAAFA